MPRISHNVLKENDKLMFQALAKVGHISQKQMLDEFDIKPYRLKQFQKQNRIEQVVDKKSGDTYYKIHKNLKASKKQLINICGTDRIYHAQSPHHDKELANKYFSLNQEQRDTWKSETDLKLDFNQMLKQMEKTGDSLVVENEHYFAADLRELFDNGFISTPDCAYVEEYTQEYTCYESVTNNYTQGDIDAKFCYCQVMNMNISCVQI